MIPLIKFKDRTIIRELDLSDINEAVAEFQQVKV